MSTKSLFNFFFFYVQGTLRCTFLVFQASQQSQMFYLSINKHSQVEIKAKVACTTSEMHRKTFDTQIYSWIGAIWKNRVNSEYYQEH